MPLFKKRENPKQEVITTPPAAPIPPSPQEPLTISPAAKDGSVDKKMGSLWSLFKKQQPPAQEVITTSPAAPQPAPPQGVLTTSPEGYASPLPKAGGDTPFYKKGWFIASAAAVVAVCAVAGGGDNAPDSQSNAAPPPSSIAVAASTEPVPPFSTEPALDEITSTPIPDSKADPPSGDNEDPAGFPKESSSSSVAPEPSSVSSETPEQNPPSAEVSESSSPPVVSQPDNPSSVSSESSLPPSPSSTTPGSDPTLSDPEPDLFSEPEPTPPAPSSASSSSNSNQGGNGGTGNSDNFYTYDNADQQQTSANYVLNTNTEKFHYPYCSSVKQIAPQNYETFYGTRDEAVSLGYSPCGRCNP